MIICYKTKTKLNSADKKVISRLNEYGIDGYLIRNKYGVLLFHLRKPGMLSYFKVSIRSKSEIENGFKELKLLDRALTERVEQEERAKQCGLILSRISRLSKEPVVPFISPDYLEMLLERHDISKEVRNLILEVKRLDPSQATTYVIGGYQKANPWVYWEIYIFNVGRRSWKVDYIPIYDED